MLTGTVLTTPGHNSSAHPKVTRVIAGWQARAIGVQLKADNANQNGPCPITINFRGYIKSSAPGTVKYTFTRSDGATAPVFTLEFKDAGIQEVTTSWTLGEPPVLAAYEGWQAIKVLSPNQLESNHETGSFAIKRSGGKEKPDIRFGPATPVTVMPSGTTPGPQKGKQTGDGQVSATDQRGTFRVTLLGFVVNHETRDTLLETDGKRDEVFQAPVVLTFDRDRGLETQTFSAFGPVYGDTNNHPTVIRAGTASDRGGLRTGDSFPAPRPWEGRTPPGPGLGFPAVLFEGELRPIHNAAIIIPSLWEFDGSAELFTPYMDMIERAFPTIRINVGHILAVDDHFEFRARGAEGFGLENAVTLDERIIDMRNRPIGMKRSAPGQFSFNPQVLVLTYEGARDALTRDRGFGPGVIEVRYDEPQELEGSYSIYLKVERVP